MYYTAKRSHIFWEIKRQQAVDYIAKSVVSNKQQATSSALHCKEKRYFLGDKISEKKTDIIFLTTVEDIRTSSKKWLHKNLLVLLVNKTDTRTTHLSKGVII